MAKGKTDNVVNPAGKSPKNTKERDWVDAIEVFASISAVIGLFFVYLQLKENEQQTKLNTFGQVYSQMVDIDKFFVEHPEARLYVYANLRPDDVHPNASPEQRMIDYSIESAVAELMLDFFSQVTLVLPNLGDPAQGWITYIKDVYKCSPIVRERYDEKLAWYKEEAAAVIINQAKEELKQGKTSCDSIKPPPKR